MAVFDPSPFLIRHDFVVPPSPREKVFARYRDLFVGEGLDPPLQSNIVNCQLKKPPRRAVHHSEESVLNRPFPA